MAWSYNKKNTHEYMVGLIDHNQIQIHVLCTRKQILDLIWRLADTNIGLIMPGNIKIVNVDPNTDFVFGNRVLNLKNKKDLELLMRHSKFSNVLGALYRHMENTVGRTLYNE